MKNYRKIYNEKFKGFFQRCNTLFHLVSTFRKHCWSFVLSNEIKSLGKLNILLEFLCEYFKTWIFRIITKVYHERGLICSRISSLFAPFWAQCFISEKFMKMGFQYSLVVVFFFSCEGQIPELTNKCHNSKVRDTEFLKFIRFSMLKIFKHGWLSYTNMCDKVTSATKKNR